MVLSLGVLSLWTSNASAQGFGRFGGGGGAMLLSNKGVQQELKLNAEQQKKVEALAEVLREKMTGLREKLQDVPQEERFAKMAELMRPINDEMKKSLGEIVSPAQLTRFNQITLQQRFAQAFGDPEVAGKLKLTEDQKTKIQGIAQGANEQRREIMQGFQDDREGTMKKLTDLNKDLMSKSTALLSADQKAIWKDMVGEPFEVRFEPRPPQ
jgi:hypothetical protein